MLRRHAHACGQVAQRRGLQAQFIPAAHRMKAGEIGAVAQGRAAAALRLAHHGLRSGPAAAVCRLPVPDAQYRGLGFERAVALQQTEQVAFLCRACAGPAGEGAVVVEQNFVTRNQFPGLDPIAVQPKAVLGDDLAHRVVRGQAQAVAFDRLQGESLFAAGGEKAGVRGTPRSAVHHQFARLAEQFRHLARPLAGEHPGVAGDARIGRLEISQLRRSVIAVGGVDEQHPGFAVVPGQVDDAVEHLAGAQGVDHLAGGGVHQVVFAIVAHRGHEGVGDGHAEVEVGEPGLVLLGGDELENVRVIHAEHAHVGASALAALLDGFGGGVEHLHEGQRPRGHALGGLHRRVLRPQPRERVARTAAGLVHQGAVAHGREDAVHGVVHRQHEAGGELAEIRAGVHQAGRVGQEVEGVDHAEEAVAQPLEIGEIAVHPGHRVADPAAEGFPVFERLTGRVLQIVSTLEHGFGGFGELLPGDACRHGGPRGGWSGW